MIFNADIKTCGELIYDSLGLYFSNDACFMYASFSGSLPNPGFGKFPTTCQDPWTCCEDQLAASCE